jgi:flavin reductase ActVB
MTISRDTFKSLLSQLAGVVSVITTCDRNGQAWGFTASSFCSLSLVPPLVLFCLAKTADCFVPFINARYFAVSILSSEQRELAERFAIKGNDKYRDILFEAGQRGAPLLPGALAYLECSVHAMYPGGDHTIIIGLVEQGTQGILADDLPGEETPLQRPLLYYARSYGTFSLLGEESA